jgi:hypothetical protein
MLNQAKQYRVTVNFVKNRYGTYDPDIVVEDGTEFMAGDADFRNHAGWVVVQALDEAEAVELARQRMGF